MRIKTGYRVYRHLRRIPALSLFVEGTSCHPLWKSSQVSTFRNNEQQEKGGTMKRRIIALATALTVTIIAPLSMAQEQRNERKLVYFEQIPIEGMIGSDVRVKAIREIFKECRQRGVQHIVFDVKSPGGSVSEVTKISQLAEKYSDQFTYHTIIRESMSAAIVFPLISSNWWADVGARMGAATSYSKSKTGRKVHAKINSAWAASLRLIAKKNGYPKLLPHAMVVTPAKAFGWVDQDGNARVTRRRPENVSEGIVFKAEKGSVLTLTGAQLRDLGLAQKRIDESPRALLKSSLENGASVVVRDSPVLASKIMKKYAERFKEAKKVAFKELPQAVNRLKRLVQKAKEQNPRNYSYRYKIDSGALTARSWYAWRDNCEAAIDAWKRVRNLCRKIADATKEAESRGQSVPINKGEVENIYGTANQRISSLREQKDRRTIDGL
jgi:hypothetical protein